MLHEFMTRRDSTSIAHGNLRSTSDAIASTL